MWRLVFAGNFRYFNFIETRRFQPCVELRFAKPRPPIAQMRGNVGLVVFEQIEDHHLSPGAQDFVCGNDRGFRMFSVMERLAE